MASPNYWQFGILAGVKPVTIPINDLFEFEGQPVPAQWPDNAAVEAMARRQCEFLRQPLQIEIGEHTVTISFTEEASAAQDEAARLAERADMDLNQPFLTALKMFGKGERGVGE